METGAYHKLFLLAFRHLETLYILSLVFIQTGNRKSELCKASILSLSLYLLWSTSGIRSWTPVAFAYLNDLPNTSKFLIFHLFDADCSCKNLNDLELISNQELHAVLESGMTSNRLALSILKEREAINRGTAVIRGNTVIDLEESCCWCLRSCSSLVSSNNSLYVAVLFLVSLCFLIFLVFIFFLVSGPAVIGHSCCGVPANVLFVCLFVFLAKLIKLKR